ncbi:MAG: hypothetical protein ACFFCG_13090, partial [Promethearchaeota archaeon]
VDIARELLKLNSEIKYLEHANSLFSEGKLQLALHILDIIITGTDEQNVKVLIDALKLKLKILKIKIKEEPSFIANNILDNGAHQIKARLNRLQNSE